MQRPLPAGVVSRSGAAVDLERFAPVDQDRAQPSLRRQRELPALGALLIVALLLRLWAVGEVPPGMDSDEVSIGYNAYAILRTGRDEYGVLLPSAFRAFGEYKRPVYVYAAVPSIAALGLTPLAVRLPAVLGGTLSVGALYLVARLLLRRRAVALAAAGMLAISPWHLQFSRAAREISLMLLFLLLMVAALLAAVRWSRRQPHLAGLCLTGAAVALLGVVYAYPGGLLIGPLLVAVVCGVYRRRLRCVPARWVLVPVVVLAAGAGPLAAQFLDGRARERLSQAALTSDPALLALSAARVQREQAAGGPWGLHTPALLAARRAVGAYLSHFNPTYLFTRGDANWRHRVSEHGELYLWDLPLVLAGISFLVRHRWRPASLVLSGWLLVGPAPAALATEAPHAVRSLSLLPALYLLAATGMPVVWRALHRRTLRALWLVLLAASVAFYLLTYYRYYAFEQAGAWSNGAFSAYRLAAAEVEAGRFRRVVVPNYLEYAYVYGLFAIQYDPQRYLDQGGTAQLLARPISREPVPLRFAPFEMRYVAWEVEPRDPDTLYLLWLIEGRNPPPDLRPVQVIRDLTGHEAFMLATFRREP